MLLEAQHLALGMVVIGIKDLGDRFRRGGGADGIDIVAAVESFHVKAGAFGFPQAQHRDALAVEAGYIHIVRHGVNGLILDMIDPVMPAGPALLDAAAEFNRHGAVRFDLQPDAAARQPVVGRFRLPAVDDALLEDTVFIQDGIAHGRQLVGGHRVEIACRQAAKPAVSKPRVRLKRIHALDIDAQTVQGGRHGVLDAEVVKAILERTSHQEFHAHVVNLFAGARVVVRVKKFVFFTEDTARYTAQRLIVRLIRSVLRIDQHIVFKGIQDQVFQDGLCIVLFCIDSHREPPERQACLPA